MEFFLNFQARKKQYLLYHYLTSIPLVSGAAVWGTGKVKQKVSPVLQNSKLREKTADG